MSDKRTIRRSLKKVRAAKTWQLLILFILSLFLSATFLRLNNTEMLSRRDAVESADKAGDDNATEQRIYDLQQFATAHMNADTGVFYLQEQYNRDVKAAIAKASGDSGNYDGYSTPQARADAICNPNLQIHGYSKAYQDCMLKELSKAGQVIDPTSVKEPDPSLYRYSFTSPVWSPDLAGFTVLISVILALVILVRLLILVILHILLKRHYRHL